MRQIIHIYGASGSGTTTLGKKLCQELGYKFMDTDDYFWLPTNPPYTMKRDKCECLRLMKEDIEEAENVVVSGSLVDWGDELIPLFTLAIRLKTDTEVRIDRLRRREYEKFGSRIEPGGDMYEKHQEFLEWAGKYDSGSIDMRSRAKHDLWQQLLQCHQIVLDGTHGLNENFQAAKEEIDFIKCVDKVIMSVKELFNGEASGHDYWHSIRVYHNACRIALNETCKWEVVALASLLHDADDSKLFQTENYQNARNIMTFCNIAQELQEDVVRVISTVSFKGKDTVTPLTIEGKIVQDADRLDAIGAVGIARAFAFGGNRGRRIYEPGEKPRMDLSEKDYKTYKGTTVNHFYEKLFLLKDLMNTDTAKKIAEKRDAFMRQFMDEFYNEWNGVC